MKRWATIVAAALLASCETTPNLATADMPSNTSRSAYRNEVMSRMNVVWRVLAAAKADRLTVGTISLTFRIEPEGRVSNPMVASNSCNEALAEVARRTIEHTRIPAIPRAALAQLPDGYMSADCSFTVYLER